MGFLGGPKRKEHHGRDLGGRTSPPVAGGLRTMPRQVVSEQPADNKTQK